jgi:Tfp pilus assembly protein PilN
MFTIDLLKGTGLPEKGRARNVAVVALAGAVPFVLAIVMLGFYLHGRIGMAIRSAEIDRWKTKTANLADALNSQKELERDKAGYSASLAEIGRAMGRHVQWSPILATVVSSMPESVVLTALEVKQHAVRVNVPAKDDPKQTKDISVPVPTLKMNVAAMPQSDADKDVREFRTRLLASDLLGPRLEDITVSQKADELNKLDVVSYEINCLFKPQL